MQHIQHQNAGKQHYQRTLRRHFMTRDPLNVTCSIEGISARAPGDGSADESRVLSVDEEGYSHVDGESGAARIRRAIGRLPDPRHRTMLHLRTEGWTLQQMGDHYGVTRERARQILAKAREQLREDLGLTQDVYRHRRSKRRGANAAS